jgi:hypothetical protein
VARAAALSVEPFTLTVPRGCGISTQMLDEGAWECSKLFYTASAICRPSKQAKIGQKWAFRVKGIL